MVKSKGEKEPDSADKQKNVACITFQEMHVNGKLDFLKDSAGNAFGIYIFSTSLSCFCLRGRNSRLEDHPHNGFGEAPV